MNETNLSASLDFNDLSFSLPSSLTTPLLEEIQVIDVNSSSFEGIYIANVSSIIESCQFLGTRESYVIVVVYTLIFLLSVIGNVLVIIVILQQRAMRSITNIYLMNLAITDLMLSVVCMPSTLVQMVTHCWLLGMIMCKLIAYLQPMVVTASAYTLAVIAFERYYAICKPLHSRIWQTRSHAYAMISLVWLIALLANLAFIFMFDSKSYDDGVITCEPSLPFQQPFLYLFIYQVYMTTVLLVIPLVVMAVLYGSVISTLKSGIKLEIAAVENSFDQENSTDDMDNTSQKFSMFRKLTVKLTIGKKGNTQAKSMIHRKSETSVNDKSIRSTHNQKSALAKQRVIKMLIVIVIIFFCCWTPNYIWWLMIRAADSVKDIWPIDVWNADVNTVITILPYISSCTNPITYCFLNKKFRNAIKAMFGRKKQIRHHFQKVYVPINNGFNPSPNNNDKLLNRSASSNCNHQHPVVSNRMLRRSSSSFIPSQALQAAHNACSRVNGISPIRTPQHSPKRESII